MDRTGLGDSLTAPKYLKRPVSTSRSRLSFFIPDGDEQPFRYALYNVVMLMFLLLCGAAVVAVFCLFHAFLKPMAWAALAGTLIFPLKNVVSSGTKGWLRQLKRNNTPLIVGFIFLPITLLDRAVDRMWDFATSDGARYLFVIYPIALCLAKYKAFSSIIILGTKLFSFLDCVIGAFSGKWVVPLWLLYCGTYIVWLWLQGPDQANSVLAKGLAIPAWFVSFCVVAKMFGPLRTFVFLGLSALVGLCEAGVLGSNPSETIDSSESSSTPQQQQPGEETAVRGDALDSVVSTAKHPEKPITDWYIECVLGACGLLWFATHLWLMYMFIVPLIYMAVKKLGSHFGIWTKIYNCVCGFFSTVKEKGSYVLHAAIPSSVRNLGRMLFSGDQAVIDGLEQSMDVLSSVIVIILVIFLVIITSFFVVFQVHSETTHLIELGTNVWNQTASGNETGQVAKWIHQSVDQALGGQSLDDAIEDGYQYARVWLSEQVRSYVGNEDPEKGEMLEDQVKQLVDRLYQMWLTRQKPALAERGDDSTGTVTELMADLTSSFDIMTIKDDLMKIVQENMETFKSVLQSLMAIIQSNMALVTSLLTGMIGVVMNFGFELINLLISGIVFLTVLYYLLAISTTQWKPLEWFSSLTPSGQQGSAAVGATQTQKSPIVEAVEESIKGVFILSIKKIVFYGAYTWFVHTLFDVNVVFVPSIIAALLAAIPLTATFWICLPGVLELYLVRDQAALAAIFFCAHVLPTLVVDSALIKEVKGSHPYMTGLAIVGGMYWLGISGAIVGPLVLCICLVIFKVYRSLWSQEAGFASADVQSKPVNLVVETAAR